ncbi:DUF5318 family protein [Corynebacterium sp.]|uniref:DUF5318 family protein n=1 Tax=Corynebacterium sp. TaxID=1720 RepID=UPI002A9189B1|nr:DUF5318 family protein [Corynebacterium sp.]MDY5785467.1 DUF5318 family protein [Corynebacterium sp.]
MFAYTREISHELQRRATLQAYARDAVDKDFVCDADFLLRAAAQHHGVDSPRPCPICEKTMRVVAWVYGENLGRRSGTARSAEEIDALVAEVGSITVHQVEVCTHCRWNHLLKELTASPVV